MATSKLPRGVQLCEYVNKDNSTTTKYRVRIERKSFKGKRSNYFDDLKEAISFLNLSKEKKGQELIYSITEEQRIKNSLAKNNYDDTNYTLGYFIDKYIEMYIFPDNEDTELKKRNRTSKISFFKTIRNTSILDRKISAIEKLEFGVDDNAPTYKFMNGFDIRHLKPIDINNYIRERLKFIKPISVVRELSFISNIYNNISNINDSEELEGLANPVLQYDKKLLKNTVSKREFSISPADEIKFFDVLHKYSNPELFNICKVYLLTSLRRSEVITLKPEQIKNNYIQLTIAKSGKPRKVYIDNIAKEFLSNLKPYKKDKFFKYSISGFDRVFRNLMLINELSHIHFHDLRRLKISRTLQQIGVDNSIFVAEFLGFQSVKKLEEFHVDNQMLEPTNQKEMLKGFAHSSPDITKKHYFNFDFNQSNSIANRIKELKEKKQSNTITKAEEEELLRTLLQLSN